MTSTEIPSSHPPVNSGPFAGVRLPAMLAVTGMLAAGTWTVFGPWLPGGRWVAVHLFTLGVLTPAVVGFTAHFTGSLLMTRAEAKPPIALLAIGIVGTLIGVGAGIQWVSGIAATLLTWAVTVNYVRIRRARKASLQPRWVWMARRWERAHGAFIHGAILGILMAVGWLPGAWYGTARLAHLHVNLLGWGGITLLATACMFGPMALRTRMQETAPSVTARWTSRAATGLTVGVLALLATAVGGGVGTGLRILAAAGLAVYAVGASVVATILVRTRATAPGRHWNGDAIVLAVVVLAVAAWLDVAMVATASWRYLDGLGVLVIAGTLLLAIVGALGTVAPWTFGGDRPGRDRVRGALERLGYVRLAMVAGGTAIAAVGAGVRSLPAQATVVRSGWALVILAVAWSIAEVARQALTSPK